MVKYLMQIQLEKCNEWWWLTLTEVQLNEIVLIRKNRLGKNQQDVSFAKLVV